MGASGRDQGDGKQADGKNPHADPGQMDRRIFIGQPPGDGGDDGGGDGPRRHQKAGIDSTIVQHVMEIEWECDKGDELRAKARNR